jgi:hypothetical protein
MKVKKWRAIVIREINAVFLALCGVGAIGTLSATGGAASIACFSPGTDASFANQPQFTASIDCFEGTLRIRAEGQGRSGTDIWVNLIQGNAANAYGYFPDRKIIPGCSALDQTANGQRVTVTNCAGLVAFGIDGNAQN